MRTFKHLPKDELRCNCHFSFGLDKRRRKFYVEENTSLAESKGNLIILSQKTCPICNEYYWYFAKGPIQPQEYVL